MTATAIYRASAFLQSIGVNTHIDWQNSGSGYADAVMVEASIAYLGVTHVRDSVPYRTWTLPEYAAIAATGVTFDIIVTTPDVDIASDLSQIDQLAEAVPASVASIEGPNEFNTSYDTFDGVDSYNDPAWAQLVGPALYAAVQADPALAGVTVIAASMANAGATQVGQEGNLGGFVDSSNWHVYYADGVQPGQNIAGAAALATATAPGEPVSITETGYYTAIDAMGWGGGGVTPAVQAILTVNALLDGFHDGVATTYLYELMDDIADPSSTDLADSFGLFEADGTPKPAATAIHNLTTILADPGADATSFTQGTLADSIEGLPHTGQSMTFEKSNGAFDVVIWNEPHIWNETSKSQITPTAAAITVELGAVYGLVELFDPLVGSAPIETLTEVSQVQLSLGADPYIVEIEPYPAPQTYSPGDAGGTIDSAGADTVLVGAGAVSVVASGPTIRIVGGAGALTYSGTAQASITGGAGAMDLTLSGSGSSIVGGSGGMTVLDLVGGNTITGAADHGHNGITVTTTTGNDSILTGSWTGVNVINLGAGNDTVVANGNSKVTGSTGNDTITVNGSWGNVVTGTGSSVVQMNTVGTVTTNGQDSVQAAYGLTLIANGPTTSVTGGDGFMWFAGHGSATVTGGSGGGYFDLRAITAGIVTTAADAIDTIRLGAAGGTVNSYGTDAIQVGSGAASIDAFGPQVAITGGAGALTYSGTAAATIKGSAGAMNLFLSGAGGSVTGGAGGMTLIDTVGGNSIVTTTGDDSITTGASNGGDVISLGSGNDTVATYGNGQVTGSTGNDTITMNGSWGTLVTGTGSSVVQMNAAGTVTTNGQDTVQAFGGLSISTHGPSANVTAGNGYMWLSGTGNVTVTGGSGGGTFNLAATSSSAIGTALGARDSIMLGAAGGVVTTRGHDSVQLGSGDATISALAGNTTVHGAAGQMSFTEGAANATVTAGSGAADFTLVAGQAGGSLTVNDFDAGGDSLTLVGYGTDALQTQIIGGNTQILLSDNSRITLVGFTAPGWQPQLG